MSGLIAPKSEIDRLLDGIENGSVNRLKSINASFAEMHENYYTYEWTWAYNKIQEFYGLNPDRNNGTRHNPYRKSVERGGSRP